MEKIDRINQLEGLKIDEECFEILYSKFFKGFQFYDSRSVNKFIPEINFFIKLIYFRLTIAKDNPQPGNQIQNLKYYNPFTNDKNLSKTQKTLYFIFEIFGGYLKQKLKHRLIYENNENLKYINIFKTIFDYFEKIYKLLDLLNFVLFLWGSQYRTLIERVLRMRIIYFKPDVSRSLDFEYMNRTILWNLLSEIVTYGLPIINNLKLTSQFKEIFYFTTFLGSLSENPEIDANEEKCHICEDDDKTMPYKIKECDHEFCYYCISTYMGNVRENEWECPKCKVKFTEIIEN